MDLHLFHHHDQKLEPHQHELSRLLQPPFPPQLRQQVSHEFWLYRLRFSNRELIALNPRWNKYRDAVEVKLIPHQVLSVVFSQSRDKPYFPVVVHLHQV